MLTIKVEKFEGPLSLLLKLIQKEELDITEISLAKIADQFVEYLNSLDSLDPEEMADFLVVAVKLLLIKSKALLPRFVGEEEEAEIQELEEQLFLYKKFFEAARVLETKWCSNGPLMFGRESGSDRLVEGGLFSPPASLNKESLAGVLREFLRRFAPGEKMAEEILDRKISLEERIAHIQNILLERLNCHFSFLVGQAESKAEVIVSFLALLELVKQRELAVEQGEVFEEIFIAKI